MTDRWFYSHNKQKLGPFDLEAIKQLLASGQIQATDMIWQEGTAKWLPASTIVQIQPLATPPPAPAECIPPNTLKQVGHLQGQAQTAASTQPDGIPAHTVAFEATSDVQAPAAPRGKRSQKGLAVALMSCPACNAQVSKEAIACPKCAHPFQKAKPSADASRKQTEDMVKGIGCLVLIVIAVLGYNMARRKEKEKASMMPPDQSSFAKLMEDFRDQYGRAINPITKTEARRKRALAIQATLRSLKVSNWIGTISRFDTTLVGESGILEVSFPDSHASVRTTSGVFGLGSTNIAKDSALYRTITGLKVGDVIVFGGEFERPIGGQGWDHINEASITEGGSMDSPSFYFTFSDIRKLPTK